jgi:diguanylate cyclase (GGDEF)-like protein
MTAKSKLITTLTLILVLSFIATSLVNYAFTRAAVRAELMTSSLPLTGKSIYSEVHADMLRPILVSTAMAHDAFLKDWILSGEKDLDAITNYLSAFRSKYGFMTTFFVSAVTDTYYYQEGIMKKIGARDPHDVWFYAFARSKNEFDLDIDPNEAENGALTIFANFRVEDNNGRFLGVVGVGVNIDRIRGLLEKVRSDYSREVYLVDQDGLVQVHRDSSRIERYDITKAGGIRDVAGSILENVDDPRTFEYDDDGDNILLSSRYIPELQWHLIVEQNENLALISARNNLIRTLVIGIVATILIVILCTITINHYQHRLEKLAKTDPLTGLANRRVLEEVFAQSAYKAARYSAPFSAIIFDLDKFKEINDKHGHLKGDDVLKSVADITRRTIRPSDLVARWGGDEFIILMDGRREDALILAKRILCAVNEPTLENPVSFSYGLTEFQEGDTLESMTKRADQAMYKAKSCEEDQDAL